MSFHLDFLQDPAEFARTVAEQRKWLRKLASMIEADEPLDRVERAVVVAVLRAHADGIASEPRRKRGQAPRIDASNVALEFEALIRNPNLRISKNAAQERLAERHDVSVEAIRKALKKKGADAAAFFDSFGV